MTVYIKFNAHNTVLCSGNVSQAAQAAHWSSLCYQRNGQGLRVNFQMCDKPNTLRTT